MPAFEVKLPDIKPIITKAQQQMMEIHKTVTEGIYGWTEVTKGFDESLSNFIAGSIEAAVEAIGQIIAGDLGFDGLMKAILLQLASFPKQIGAQLIKFGVMIIAFKMALKSVLANPWTAIAIGAAMVAGEGDNPNARIDPEVIAPLSKLQGMKSGGRDSQNIQIALSGQLTAKGRDLVYVFGK